MVEMLGQFGLGLASNAINQQFDIAAENRANQRNLQYYQMQRADALTDMDKMNEYNSPLQQVQRLKQANMSPYLMQGQGNITSMPRSSSISSSPAMNTVNNQPVQLLSMQKGIEEVRTQKLQNQILGTEAKQRELQYSVDAETMRSKAIASIWQQEATLNDTKQSIEQKKQTVENMKQNLLLLVEDTQLKKTQNIYQNDLLAGNVRLQKAQHLQIMAQTNKIKSEIERINIQNNQDVKRFSFQLEELQQRITSLKLDNEFKNYENANAVDYLYSRNKKSEYEANKAKYESDYMHTLSPETRHFMDKTSKFIPTLMKAFK